MASACSWLDPDPNPHSLALLLRVSPSLSLKFSSYKFNGSVRWHTTWWAFTNATSGRILAQYHVRVGAGLTTNAVAAIESFLGSMIPLNPLQSSIVMADFTQVQTAFEQDVLFSHALLLSAAPDRASVDTAPVRAYVEAQQRWASSLVAMCHA